MKPVKGQDMDQEHPHLGALVGGSTGSPMCASPETMDTSLSPHTPTAVQATADNRMSSGAPETGAGNDSSLPRLEDERTDTPASDISSSDVASGLHPSDETQDTANTTEEQTFYKRELRPKRRMLPCTWIDADTTGDFDPREEAHKARPRRKKVKTSHRGNHDWNGEGHTNEPAPELETRTQPPPALCIRFNSSAGKLAYSELCAKLDREVKPPRDNWTAGYQLRKRKSISHDPFSGTLGVQATGVRVIASELLGDFTNHPVARGCFDCLAIGSRCSLLDNEHSWPCEECKDNDNDCQLVKVCRSLSVTYFPLLTPTGARNENGLHALSIPRQETEVVGLLIRIQPGSFQSPRSMRRVPGRRPQTVYCGPKARPCADKKTHRMGWRTLHSTHERAQYQPEGFSKNHMPTMSGMSQGMFIQRWSPPPRWRSLYSLRHGWRSL